jgi:protein tyrosine phosphatase (PTP) superfamily phosphohydrolase (DUF442 family)
MKSIKIILHWMQLLLIIICIVPILSLAQKSRDIISPILIDSTVNLYEAGDFFLSGQPEKETLDLLKEKGVTLVVNVRTNVEMDLHNRKMFDEPGYIKDLDMKYLHVEVGGDAGFTPEAVKKVADGIKDADGKILIHCRGAGRATLVWMAWLINYDGYSINNAIELGKNAVFSFPLENLLGYPVKMKKGK